MQQVKELSGGADLDAVIVPIGGGGLISGVATAVKSLCPGIRVIGAEPQKAADAFRSKQVLRATDALKSSSEHLCFFKVAQIGNPFVYNGLHRRR